MTDADSSNKLDKAEFYKLSQGVFEDKVGGTRPDQKESIDWPRLHEHYLKALDLYKVNKDSEELRETTDKCFDMIDVTGDRSLDKEELTEVLVTLSYTREGISRAFVAMDADGSGVLDKEEFYKLSQIVFE